MQITQKLIRLAVFMLIIPTYSYAETLENALNKISLYFVKTAVNIPQGENLIIDIVNFHSQKKDPLSIRIETDLYFALESRNPDFKLFLASNNQTVNNPIIVKGVYKQKNSQIVLQINATRKNRASEILAQIEVEFEIDQNHEKGLVAVLDIDAETFNKEQKKAFSEIFRSILDEIDEFNLTSSGTIDKLDPDAIQDQTGCSRDSCATIIGEQLGVDRVLSSAVYQLGENQYLISARLLNVNSGSIIISRSIKYDSSKIEIDAVLEDLAYQITGKRKKTPQQLFHKRTMGLGKTDYTYDNLPKGFCPIPKPFTDLTDCDFSYKTLKNISLEGSNLENVDFRYSTLDNISFQGAKVEDADLRHSKFSKLNFKYAKLEHTDWRYSKLFNIVFTNGIIQDSDFRYTHLTDTQFDFADLTDSDFRYTHLKKVTFKKTILDGVNSKYMNIKH